MLTASVKEAPSPVTVVHHTTVIYCLKQVGKNLPGATLCAMPIPQRGRTRWVGNLCRCKKNLHRASDGSWPQEAGGLRLGVALSIVPRHLCT